MIKLDYVIYYIKVGDIMDFLDDINNETLIICSRNVKDYIIRLNLLKPIKIMTIDEFRRELTFSYDEEAILYVMKEYNINYEIAKEYIENIYYVNNKTYGYEKLDLLVDIKNKLDSQNLLIYNEYFKDYLDNIKIIIYDIKLNDYYLELLKPYNYKVINRKFLEYNHDIYEFKTIEDEVYYVAYQICELISKGIDINNIKLTNIDKNYYNVINRIFSLFNLKVNINYQRKLASFETIRNFIKLYRECDDINQAIKNIQIEEDIYSELIKVINKYISYDNQELLIYKIENTNISSTKYDNAIEIIDYIDDITDDNIYVFMLGFNEGIIPKYQMDTNYITDNLTSLVGIDSISSINKYIKERTIKTINNIKNLTITYKLADYSKSYYVSSISNNFNIITSNTKQDISYSKKYDLIRLIKMYDEYMKYGEINIELPDLKNTYKIDYNTYDNRFKGTILLPNKLYLSYTKTNTFNKCKFRYYLDYVMDIDKREETTSIVIGNMVHFVLQKCLEEKSNDIEKYTALFLGDTELNNKERYYLNKYKDGLHEMLDFIILARNNSELDEEEYEKKIDISLDDDTHFVGIIDKLLAKDENNTKYIAIVDYKTGNDDINFDYLDNGINIQLPIYMYLASKINSNNIKYVGFYLEKFDIVNKDYRLIGYTNSDKEIISLIDSEYDNSKIIKGLKTNKDGSFSRYSKIISEEEINDIISKVDMLIRKTVKEIKDGKFSINPKVTDLTNIGCMYCKYNDICFKKKEDEVIISN